MGGEDDPLGIVQESEIQPYYQVVYAPKWNPFCRTRHKIFWDFAIETDLLIRARSDVVKVTKKMEFAE